MAGYYQVNVFNHFQDWLKICIWCACYKLVCLFYAETKMFLIEKGESKSILSLHPSTFVAPFLGLLQVVKVKFNPKFSPWELIYRCVVNWIQQYSQDDPQKQKVVEFLDGKCAPRAIFYVMAIVKDRCVLHLWLFQFVWLSYLSQELCFLCTAFLYDFFWLHLGLMEEPTSFLLTWFVVKKVKATYIKEMHAASIHHRIIETK